MVEVQGSRQFLEVDMQGDGTEDGYGPQTNRNNGFSHGEDVYGTQNTVPVWRGIPIVEDGFTISGAAQRSGEAVKANITNQRPGQLTGFEVGGSVNVIAAPMDTRDAYDRSVLSWFLGAGINRDPDDGQQSYTMRWTTPGISQITVKGAKCASLTVEGSEDSGIVSFSSEWVGASFAPVTDSVTPTPVFPLANTVDDTQTPTEDAIGWVFARAYLYTVVDDAAVFLAALRSISINVNNNLTPKAQKVQTVVSGADPWCSDTFVVTGIREGQQEISGTFVVDYTTVDYQTYLAQNTELEIALIGRHPQSGCFQPTATGVEQSGGAVDAEWSLATADTTITLTTTVGSLDAAGTAPDGAFALDVGGAVLIEDTGTTAGFPSFDRDVGVIKTAFETSGDTLVIDAGGEYWTTIGVPFESNATPDSEGANFILYDQAFGIHVTGVRIDTAPLQGGPGDIIGQEINWTAGQGSTVSSAITWVTGDPGNELTA